MRVLHLPFPQALMDHHSALLSADPIAQVCSFTCPSCRAAPCSPACRKGKRSALMDHQMKNKEHKQLVAEMEAGLKRVMLVGGVAHRLAGKVAIITGGLSRAVLWGVPTARQMATVAPEDCSWELGGLLLLQHRLRQLGCVVRCLTRKATSS